MCVLALALLAVVVVQAQQPQGEQQHHPSGQHHHQGDAHKKRPFTCLFFPGEGLDWPELDVEEKDRATHPKFVREEFHDYWGHEIKRELTTGQRCEKVLFYDTDTSYRTWREKSLAFEFDNVIKRVRPHVVFAHGSGNLVLTSCIKRKLPNCDLISKKIDWYGIQAPLRGTDVAKVMRKLCPTLVADKTFGGGVDCVRRNDTKTGKPVIPAVYDIAASWDGLRQKEIPGWVATIASERMRGSMCGVMATDYSKPPHIADKTAFGALAKAMGARKGKTQKDWQARNQANARVPTYGNDGIVPLSSCKLNGNKRYEKVPTAKFYVVDGNHDFGTCSNGQVDLSGDREPCTWMANMVKKTRKSKGLPHRFAEVNEEDEDESEDETEAKEETEEEAEGEDEAEAEEEDGDSESEEADAEDE